MDRGHERRPTHRPGRVAPVPLTMAELARYALPRALRWERPPAAAEPRHPAADELEILMALGALGVLSTSQIHRRYLDGLSPRGLRHRLQSMAAQGWLRRGHLLCAGPGQTPRIWSLTDSGRGLAEARLGADPFEVVWDDLDQVVHALHVAAWWLAFERVAGRQVELRAPPEWRALDEARPRAAHVAAVRHRPRAGRRPSTAAEQDCPPATTRSSRGLGRRRVEHRRASGVAGRADSHCRGSRDGRPRRPRSRRRHEARMAWPTCPSHVRTRHPPLPATGADAPIAVAIGPHRGGARRSSRTTMTCSFAVHTSCDVVRRG